MPKHNILGLQPGQLVVVANHKPYHGNSLDGTLGRIVRYHFGEDSELIYVELYRRHKRTGRPLGLKEVLMQIEVLNPLEGALSALQQELVSHFELAKLQRLAHRAKLRSDNIEWERRMLQSGGHPTIAPPAIDPIQADRIDELANKSIAQLEVLLREHPPEGVSSATIETFFGRHRLTLIESVIAFAMTALGEIMLRRQQRSGKS